MSSPLCSPCQQVFFQLCVFSSFLHLATICSRCVPSGPAWWHWDQPSAKRRVFSLACRWILHTVADLKVVVRAICVQKLHKLSPLSREETPPRATQIWRELFRSRQMFFTNWCHTTGSETRGKDYLIKERVVIEVDSEIQRCERRHAGTDCAAVTKWKGKMDAVVSIVSQHHLISAHCSRLPNCILPSVYWHASYFMQYTLLLAWHFATSTTSPIWRLCEVKFWDCFEYVKSKLRLKILLSVTDTFVHWKHYLFGTKECDFGDTVLYC